MNDHRLLSIYQLLNRTLLPTIRSTLEFHFKVIISFSRREPPLWVLQKNRVENNHRLHGLIAR